MTILPDLLSHFRVVSGSLEAIVQVGVALHLDRKCSALGLVQKGLVSNDPLCLAVPIEEVDNGIHSVCRIQEQTKQNVKLIIQEILQNPIKGYELHVVH